MRRPGLLLTALLALVLATGACARIPDSGPVVATTVNAAPERGAQYVYQPLPPQPGESPTEIVQHFLDAMTATSHETGVARQFLTREAAASWNPQMELITYADVAISSVEKSADVSVTLSDANHYDRQGSWQGELPERRRTFTFPMRQENGEWRIAKAPDALIVPQEWFDQRYRQASVYFFDPTGQILVPEPVFVPRGEQFASALVQSLLRGPATPYPRVERSYLPDGSSLELSVTVEDGVAEVSLEGVGEPLTLETVPRVVAQLAWTLRQDRSIDRFSLRVDGSVVSGPGPQGTFPVSSGAAVNPAVRSTSVGLYAVRRQRVVRVEGNRASPVPGPFGVGEYAIEQVSVNFHGHQAAVVTTGEVCFVAPLTEGASAVRVAAGEDLLRPHWDFLGQLWLVDRTDAGAQVTVGSATTRREVQVPGITGRQVDGFLVSRDGSRLVAVVQRGNREAIVVSRVQRDAEGRVVGLTRATPLLVTGPGRRVIDLAWGSPTRVLVLTKGDLTRLRRIPVDGSPRRTTDAVATSLGSPVRALASSPVQGASPLVVARNQALDVAAPGADPDPLPRGISGLTYPG